LSYLIEKPSKAYKSLILASFSFGAYPKQIPGRQKTRFLLVGSARPTELPEVGQILADLRIGESERLGELAAGDHHDAIDLKRFELTQIQTESSDRGIRYLRGRIYSRHLSIDPIALPKAFAVSESAKAWVKGVPSSPARTISGSRGIRPIRSSN
jgi:hypothetical protein